MSRSSWSIAFLSRLDFRSTCCSLHTVCYKQKGVKSRYCATEELLIKLLYLVNSVFFSQISIEIPKICTRITTISQLHQPCFLNFLQFYLNSDGITIKMGKSKASSGGSSSPQQQQQAQKSGAPPGLDVCFLCGSGPATPCPDCGLVSTCGSLHRQLHRPEKLCFPFRIEFRPAVGRFMVATRDIQPLGE